jgi:histidine triad (HIT) family protein
MVGMSTAESTVFERIVARELPAKIVYEDDRIIGFETIEPQAPVHLLVVPKTAEYRDVTELAEGDPELLAQVVAVAQQLADQFTGGQYRLIFNTGERAGQTIFHVHAHVLGTPGASDDLTEGSLGF